ncbi:putative RecB family nuclease [Bradyrhizobium ottawaense]|uniref:TM0106 family RecB-like putative nuclease n=1 Tax=Bradyrhizobium ottawaense TaxID=931866 RepID=UPI00383534E7
MESIGGIINLSAGDLVGHLNCRFLTELDRKVADGELQNPKIWDPVLATLAERGALHEQSYVDHLKDGGLTVTLVEGVGIDAAAVGATMSAMERGDAVIVQGALQAGKWNGRADVLRRVDSPSRFGGWSYEVTDTKLARDTKGNTVLQICLYSDLLGEMQAARPVVAHVVTPGADFVPEEYRIADYAAYYRHVRNSLELSLASPATGSDAYPEPVEHCDICRWRRHCDERRRADDHMSLVAGISKLQIAELERRGVTTMAALAELPLPLQWRPDRGAVRSYENVREQARIQVEGRTQGAILFEALPPLPTFGLSRLPEPSQGDIFFDFEGDPFVGEGGLEFLFGYLFNGDDGLSLYVGDWASTRHEERGAFERFIDFVVDRRKAFPDLHIYHFAAYEPAALKRLMGRYATRERELDDLLRSEVFVDLYSVVRHAIRASVESYSIKKLEALYSFARSVPLEEVAAVLARTQARLEATDGADVPAKDKEAIKGYNRDDCASTELLRGWLESLRAQLLATGATIERPMLKEAEISPKRDAWLAKIEPVASRLLDGVPDDVAQRSGQQHAKWLLALMLDWHGREGKAVWWEYFRLRDLSAEDLIHERAGIGGLKFVESVGGTAKAPIHRYEFLQQDTDVRTDSALHYVGGDDFGKVIAISQEDRTVDIKKRGDTADRHPEAVFTHKSFSHPEQAASLLRLGEYVVENGIDGPGEYRAARELLLGLAPRLRGQELLQPGETIVAAAERIGVSLDESVIAIQGPPGAGKTYTAARMILRLVHEGKRVGVAAISHKVIRNLLTEVISAGSVLGTRVECVHKISDKESSNLPSLQLTTSNEEALDLLGATCAVGGGTSFFWSRADAHLSVDVLFVDEAAQMSLADVLAVSQAAKSTVLLGDPRQLEQPIQGSHPDGVAVSALDHILGAHATVPPDRGLFLAETWRLHPEICVFNSELFYEERLRSRAGLEKQEIRSTSRVSGAGLRYLPVEHVGNQNSSKEEAEAVRLLVSEILNAGSTWIDRQGVERQIRLDDILIVAPYNAQVFELLELIPGAKIGTVDKFQGQEAPIVIYSVTTSSHSDAPRGMEFLYSANRLNVAISRAKCICIIVASPRVFEAECRTPRQMQLANAFCRYLEMSIGLC